MKELLVLTLMNGNPAYASQLTIRIIGVSLSVDWWVSRCAMSDQQL